ncbi:Mariner Mos1 transposase [Acromyrmex echinatior]|uniref:Mariner Mos1 transposase n=1 Tax=Acromyrmex echinatior TaxID=103372 RepID=F4WEZ5_ACREC|nr:Mariner Mos1 transposase [Acromyrmex echinatior]
MPSFEPNKRHLRKLLIYFFNLKKFAAEHRLLVEAYGEAALTERSCREWFQKFKNGEFDVEDKERSGRPKVYENAELRALLDEDSCQTQKELALTLRAIQQAMSHCLKSLEMSQKQGNWVPHELKPRNVERRFSICEMLLVRHKRKGFLHHIVTDDEKWTTTTKKEEIMGIIWPCFNIDSQAEYSWKKTHVVYLMGLAWCRVL